jgi:UDP-N-acetylglucosamine 1-carboxyvinyltransferase
MTSLIKGVDGLKGSVVEGKDLRGGAALILAGLAAEGQTTVTNANFVERGYEHIEEILSGLGGDVRLLLDEGSM